ncbi:hypothetical protein [Rhizobium sp. 9140]|uniref:hypothetical protein n=1 Tax=Rhizobium sp. 9140 TaxID=1761900 RepID=UPI001FD9F78D|nr:hypothetical protein [Rhizobium sp. 9140]
MGALVDAGSVAMFPEPIAKALDGKWAPGLADYEGEISGLCLRQHVDKSCRKLDCDLSASLFRAHGKGVAGHVLPAGLHDV